MNAEQDYYDRIERNFNRDMRKTRMILALGILAAIGTIVLKVTG
jgi:hypothetical protein